MRSLGTALVIIAMSQSSALADETEEDKRKAQVVFDQGLKLFDQGRYGEACPKFEEALKLYYTGLGIRGKLAECYEKIGKIASAYDHYRDVIDRARARGEPDRALFASERAQILEPRLPRVIIDPGPSSELDGFTLQIGSRVLHESTFNTPVAVDPGRLVISAEADGYRIFEKQLTISERETRTIEVSALEPLSTSDSGGGSVSTLGVVLIGVGVASLGGSGYFYLNALDKREEFINNTGCPIPTSGLWVCDDSFQDDFETVKGRIRLHQITPRRRDRVGRGWRVLVAARFEIRG